MAGPLRRGEAEPSCILLLWCGRRETGLRASTHSGDWRAPVWAWGFRQDAECKGTKGARGWDGSKAKVGGKKMGFSGGSTKRFLTNPNLMAMRLGNRRGAERAGRGWVGLPLPESARGRRTRRQQPQPGLCVLVLGKSLTGGA